MKRDFFVFAAFMAFVVILSSCGGENLPHRFDAFVLSVEEDCRYSGYSEEYWMKVDERFYKLNSEYLTERSSMSSDAKREINSIIARYEFQRIDSFVSYVEDNYPIFSEDDWLIMNDRFVELIRDYKENRHAYNSREKKRIDGDILHYCKLVIKSKIPGIVETVKSILRELGLL